MRFRFLCRHLLCYCSLYSSSMLEIPVQYIGRWTVLPDELRRSFLKLVAGRASTGRLAKAWRRTYVLVTPTAENGKTRNGKYPSGIKNAATALRRGGDPPSVPRKEVLGGPAAF